MKQILLVDPGREAFRRHRLGYLSGNTEKFDFAWDAQILLSQQYCGAAANWGIDS